MSMIEPFSLITGNIQSNIIHHRLVCRQEDFGEKIEDQTTVVIVSALISTETGVTNGEVRTSFQLSQYMSPLFVLLTRMRKTTAWSDVDKSFS